MRLKKIVLPTDFGLNAEFASHYAKALARKLDGEIHLVHVVQRYPFVGGRTQYIGADPELLDNLKESLIEHAREKLESVALELKRSDLDVFVHVVTGDAAPAIINHSWAIEADLIVVGTHGRSGFDRLILGSTCDHLIRSSPIPVLTIKHPEHEFVRMSGDNEDTIELKRVLCPCDFSEFSHYALPYAVEFCRLFGAKLELLHIVHPVRNYVEEFISGSQEQGPFEAQSARASLEKTASSLQDVEVEWEVRSGNPANVLAESAKKTNTDLIVMATHGRSGIQRGLMGSVAEKLIRMAPCPLLTIRPVEKVESEEPLPNSKLNSSPIPLT